jgi:cytochrome c2
METKIKETIKLIRLLIVAIVVLFGVTLLSFITLKNDSQRVNVQIQPTNALPKVENPSHEMVKGKELFENNCKSCHAASDEIVIGPGLKGISQRRDLAWITKWVQNSGNVIKSGDKYGNEIFNKYNKIQMTAFDKLSGEDVKSIVEYVENQ